MQVKDVVQFHLLSMQAGLCTTAAVPLPSPSEPQQQSEHPGGHYGKREGGREMGSSWEIGGWEGGKMGQRKREFGGRAEG